MSPAALACLGFALAAGTLVVPPRIRADPPPGGAASGRRPGRWLAALAAGAAVAVLLPAPAGLVLAGPAAVATARWLHGLPTRAEVHRDRAAATALPLACDLLGAGLHGGLDPTLALRTVTAAVAPELALRLLPTQRALELGAAPEQAWRLAADDPLLAPLGQAMLRSARSGAAPSALLHGEAAERRDAARTAAQVRARSVAVWCVAPLMACFLPAFVLVGVCPLVWGLAHTLW